MLNTYRHVNYCLQTSVASTWEFYNINSVPFHGGKEWDCVYQLTGERFFEDVNLMPDFLSSVLSSAWTVKHRAGSQSSWHFLSIFLCDFFSILHSIFGSQDIKRSFFRTLRLRRPITKKIWVFMNILSLPMSSIIFGTLKMDINFVRWNFSARAMSTHELKKKVKYVLASFVIRFQKNHTAFCLWSCYRFLDIVKLTLN